MLYKKVTMTGLVMALLQGSHLDLTLWIAFQGESTDLRVESLFSMRDRNEGFSTIDRLQADRGDDGGYCKPVAWLENDGNRLAYREQKSLGKVGYIGRVKCKQKKGINMQALKCWAMKAVSSQIWVESPKKYNQHGHLARDRMHAVTDGLKTAMGWLSSVKRSSRTVNKEKHGSEIWLCIHFQGR